MRCYGLASKIFIIFLGFLAAECGSRPQRVAQSNMVEGAPSLGFEYSDDVKTSYVQYKAFDICDTSENRVLCNLNLSVHTALKYGPGPKIPNASLQDIVNYGQGDCGHFTALLTAELNALKIPNETLSVFSSRGAIHAFLQVRDRHGDFVLDPTLGLFYKHDFVSMIFDPVMSLSYLGTVPAGLAMYGGLNLFGRLDYFQIVHPFDNRFTDISISNKVAVSESQITIESSHFDFISVHFTVPLQFRVLTGFDNDYSFEAYQGEDGYYVPTYGRHSIILQFDKDVQSLLNGGQLTFIGKKYR